MGEISNHGSLSVQLIDQIELELTRLTSGQDASTFAFAASVQINTVKSAKLNFSMAAAAAAVATPKRQEPPKKKPRNGPRVCAEFAKDGKCKNGDKCKFKHTKN